MELVLKIVGGIFTVMGAIFGFLGLFLLYQLGFEPMLIFCALGGIFMAVGVGLLIAQNRMRQMCIRDRRCAGSRRIQGTPRPPVWRRSTRWLPPR